MGIFFVNPRQILSGNFDAPLFPEFRKSLTLQSRTQKKLWTMQAKLLKTLMHSSPHQYTETHGVACDQQSGIIFITENNPYFKRVAIFSQEGKFLDGIPQPQFGSYDPFDFKCVCVSKDGELLVVARGRNIAIFQRHRADSRLWRETRSFTLPKHHGDLQAPLELREIDAITVGDTNKLVVAMSAYDPNPHEPIPNIHLMCICAETGKDVSWPASLANLAAMLKDGPTDLKSLVTSRDGFWVCDDTNVWNSSSPRTIDAIAKESINCVAVRPGKPEEIAVISRHSGDVLLMHFYSTTDTTIAKRSIELPIDKLGAWVADAAFVDRDKFVVCTDNGAFLLRLCYPPELVSFYLNFVTHRCSERAVLKRASQSPLFDRQVLRLVFRLAGLLK